jgi:hypothetical protein
MSDYYGANRYRRGPRQMTKANDTGNLLSETAFPNYIEVTSKHTGGKVEFFVCPYCRIFFDAFANPQMALESCIIHAKACGSRRKRPNDSEKF